MSVLPLSDGWGIVTVEGADNKKHHKIQHIRCNVKTEPKHRSGIVFLFGNNEPWSCIWCGERVPQEVAGYWKLCASVEQE